MAKYYLGLDVHKVRTQYCLTDEAGEIVGEGNVATEAAASLPTEMAFRPFLKRPAIGALSLIL
ncbi:MAG: hypothetical protein M3256_00195 [Actinomycetota bacterium]|nr:hypothetical protein [Actinomycetota bacterium]